MSLPAPEHRPARPRFARGAGVCTAAVAMLVTGQAVHFTVVVLLAFHRPEPDEWGAGGPLLLVALFLMAVYVAWLCAEAAVAWVLLVCVVRHRARRSSAIVLTLIAVLHTLFTLSVTMPAAFWTTHVAVAGFASAAAVLLARWRDHTVPV